MCLNPLIYLSFGGRLLCVKLAQGGIIIWLCGNLRDLPDISPEIPLIKDYDNPKNLYNNAYFLKSTGNNPYLQEFIPIVMNSRQKIKW